MRKIGESYVVADINGIGFAYVYFEEDSSLRGLVNRLAGADAAERAEVMERPK